MGTIEKILNILKMKNEPKSYSVKFYAEMKLDDGRVVATEDDQFMIGSKVFAVSDDGNAEALEAGSYTMENGNKLTIGENSEILDLGEEKEAEDVEASEEDKEEIGLDVINLTQITSNNSRVLYKGNIINSNITLSDEHKSYKFVSQKDLFKLPLSKWSKKDLAFLKQKDKQQIDENYADGKKKGKSRPGRVKRAGASCKGSVTELRKKAKKYGGEKGKMYHWCANMKGGKKKSKK